MQVRFRDKKDMLTAYAFCCGYVERWLGITIYKEGSVEGYFIEGHNKSGQKVRFWERHLTEARKIARRESGLTKAKPVSR